METLDVLKLYYNLETKMLKPPVKVDTYSRSRLYFNKERKHIDSLCLM